MKKIILLLAIFASSVSTAQCPDMSVNSNGWYILFTAPVEQTVDATLTLPIDGTNVTTTWVSAGSWEANGLYNYSWTNTSGIELTSYFQIVFNGMNCGYSFNTLSTPTFEVDLDNWSNHYGKKYIVYNTLGQEVSKGVLDANTKNYSVGTLSIIRIEGLKPSKLKVSNY